ncbi:MAG: hypothetical protein K2X08_06145 [Chlamydiales bacterium]|nr:hypothetical protein [Chlamydiales bacterium]
MKLLNLAILSVFCFVKPILATKLEGIDVPDNSLTARHLPSFLKSEMVAGIEVYVSAYHLEQLIQQRDKMKEAFPGGDPRQLVIETIKNVSDEEKGSQEHVVDLLEKLADYEKFQRNVEKHQKNYDLTVGMRPIFVKVAMAVENEPEYFEIFRSELSSLDETSSWKFPLWYWGSNTSLKDEISSYQKVLYKVFSCYRFEDISDFSTQRVKKIHALLTEIPVVSQNISADELLKHLDLARRSALRKEFDITKWQNARIVIEDCVKPWLVILQEIQDESKKRKETSAAS